LLRGHLSGWYQGAPLSTNFEIAKPGDVILLHNLDGAYGYWTHTILYIGHGQVVDANNFARGTELNHVDNYRNYAEVMILRANTTQVIRQRAARFAAQAVGTPYDPLGTLADARTAYCSKLIWRSYANAGVKLCAVRDWVLPDDLANSPNLFCVAHWAAVQEKRNG